MIRTRVGYTGGTTESPTYRKMGDHTESLQVDFDPSVISYDVLVAAFWGGHNPLSGSYSAQYKAAVYFQDEEQRESAEREKKRLEGMHTIFAGRIQTQILPLKVFYLAEGYHQKYKLKRHDVLVAELLQYYTSVDALTHSTAAARLNGLFGGYGEVTPALIAELGIKSSAAIRSLPQKSKRQRI